MPIEIPKRREFPVIQLLISRVSSFHFPANRRVQFKGKIFSIRKQKSLPIKSKKKFINLWKKNWQKDNKRKCQKWRNFSQRTLFEKNKRETKDYQWILGPIVTLLTLRRPVMFCLCVSGESGESVKRMHVIHMFTRTHEKD